MTRPVYVPECVATHVGVWAAEPTQIQTLVRMAKDRVLPMRAEVQRVAGGVPYQKAADGVAIVSVDGVMMKGFSKFENTVSTAGVRRTLREVGRTDDVKAVLLRISSPGGYVDGTSDLADDVAALAERKPIEAYIEDLGASAAYWVATQAERIWANRTAFVGSIGTYQVLWDTSKAFEADGIQVHVIATAALKGAGQEGAPLTPEFLADQRRIVLSINEHFTTAVKKARGLTPKQLEAVATGQIWIAAEARALGLIDGIAGIDEVLASLAARGARGTSARPKRTAAQARLAAAD